MQLSYKHSGNGARFPVDHKFVVRLSDSNEHSTEELSVPLIPPATKIPKSDGALIVVNAARCLGVVSASDVFHDLVHGL